MAKMLQGILGAVSGKVGGVVAASWKDRQYVRGYAIPANPNTTAQQVQRGKFAKAVNFAKLLIGQVFNVYTDRFLKGMSGFNYFISRNIDHFGDPVDYSKIKITEGKLVVPVASAITASVAMGEVEITFNTNLGNNGSDSDEVFAVAYDEGRKLIGFADAPVLRSTGLITVPLDFNSGETIHAWIFAAKKNGTAIELISDSYYRTTQAVA